MAAGDAAVELIPESALPLPRPWVRGGEPEIL